MRATVTAAQPWLVLAASAALFVAGIYRDEFETMSLAAALLGGPGALKLLRNGNGQPRPAPVEVT